jgi:hypothetical protein
MEDLDLAEMAQQLLAAVRKLPPGQKRQNALKELGLLRSRTCQLVERAAKSVRSDIAAPEAAGRTNKPTL